jgi:hypothetical protein
VAEGIANLEAVIERLEQATADARAATRETHEAIKAMREVRKEAQATLNELRAAAHAQVMDLIEDAVRKGLESYSETIRVQTKTAHDTVMRGFQKLINVCIYGNEQGRGVSLFDEMRDTLQWYQEEFESIAPPPTRPDLPRLRRQ